MNNNTIRILLTYPPAMYKYPQNLEIIKRIEAVDPAIEVYEIAELDRADRNGNDDARRKLDALLAEAEIIFGAPPPRNIIARSPKLKWIQTPLAGINNLLLPEIINSSVIITNTKGIHNTQVSEWVLTLMLMLVKQTHELFKSQQDRRWQPFSPGLLESKTVGILGLGNIGLEVARLCKSFSMKVLATKSRPGGNVPHVDTVLSPESTPQLLAESDFVVITLPLTPETSNMIGKNEFEIMKPSAYLINIARGGIIDEEAMIYALSNNLIAGAGLDVFATEPLPADSALWQLPNVIVTPHVAGKRDDYHVLATDLFCENLKRYLNGDKLFNVVNKTKGY